MPDEKKKIDPFDVEALEKSLNDSATRVSTIWLSFLIFSLYLLTAATNVTHRQLFLAEPLKLPVLNIDLPLWGFFWLAPILFVIFHAYVLIQVLLLGRTAAAYNEALVRYKFVDSGDARIRQRLANTLFAQIFAGSPRERTGWFGGLLKTIAWITLAIGPILILLTFQFMFLPYHSHLATWTHRLSILLELVTVFWLWPLVLDSQQDLESHKLTILLKRIAVFAFKAFAFLYSLLAPAGNTSFEWSTLKWWLTWFAGLPAALIAFLSASLTSITKRDLSRWTTWQRVAIHLVQPQTVQATAYALFVLVCLLFATFPGEPHINILSLQAPASVHCDRWIPGGRWLFYKYFDRLDLARLDVIEDEKLAKINEATVARGLPFHRGKRTRIVRGRDLNCGMFELADLRNVDFANSDMYRANFNLASLQGASFNGADLRQAVLTRAELQGAVLDSAWLQSASLDGAKLQGASLDFAKLQGATLTEARLQGASLLGAELQGAVLNDARLQGAFLDAYFQGASLNRAQLQGAAFRDRNSRRLIIDGTGLQGASFENALLQGVFFEEAKLQGARFKGANMQHAVLSRAYVWRADNAACLDANVSEPNSEPIIDIETDDFIKKTIPANDIEVTNFIERSVRGIEDPDARQAARKQMLDGLFVDATMTAKIAQVWDECERKKKSALDSELANFLRGLVCDAQDNQKAIANGIVRNWISPDENRLGLSTLLANGLLNQDGKGCAATKNLDEPTRERLWATIAAANNAARKPSMAPAPQ